MKAIQTGEVFRIYDNSMKTYNELPAQTYLVNFSPNTGFYLTVYSTIEVKEKVYGVHESKVNKVLNIFNLANRNLGVILSGDKGIGKTLFSKILATTAIKQNIPVIIVNTYISGIAEYLNEINQEVMILFDEFDKTFRSSSNDDVNPQVEMLTLFDGIAQGKKLFVITCNDLHKLNEFLVNRPGRFHYHFRFDYPNEAEITEYLQDKVDPNYHNEISSVIDFARRVQLNYDALRAIAFELNTGLPFSEAIADLNIINYEGEEFIITIYFDNGVQRKFNRTIDLYDESTSCYCIEDPTSYDIIGNVEFTPADATFDATCGHFVIPGENVKFNLDAYLDEEDKLYSCYKDTKVTKITFRKKMPNNIHYKV